MASTTSSKKGIVDFLWEWAEGNGSWGKLLVDSVVKAEANLSAELRQEIFDFFLQDIGVKEGLPILNISKPAYKVSSSKIDLISLSEVKGVNKLSKNEVIDFAKNITVIYGENGSGKTGYGRILKALGHSYEANVNIYWDINNPGEQQQASIKYKVDNKEEVFNWDGKNSNSYLEAISVFNNNCVQISLADRGLLVSPIGFHLFNIITEELELLYKIFNATIDRHPTQISWIDDLHIGTPQEQFIGNVKGSSSIQKLEEIATYNEEHDKLLLEKKSELKNLNKSLLETEILNLQLQANEIESILNEVKGAQSVLNNDNWLLIKQLNTQIKELEGQTNKGLKEIADANNIEFYHSEEFRSFIKAADDYLKIIEKWDYPDGLGEKCIYCKQELKDSKAKELLLSYKQLLNNDIQELISTVKESKSNIIAQIAEIDCQLVFRQPVFNTIENGTPIQPLEILDYNKKVAELKNNLNKNIADEEYLFDFQCDKYVEFLEKNKSRIEAAIADKKILVYNITNIESGLQSRINELLDRQYFSAKVEDIKDVIKNKNIVSKLLKYKSAFSTNAISRKTSDAREELVQQNFNKIFTDELKALRKSDIKIELNFGTSKGQSRIQQRLNSKYNLLDILSEGEQKSIALAEFLTELQLDSSIAPVVFDDPVNSLDHHIIEDVSRRLLKLSRDRQVIVFTHSILFFNSIMHYCNLITYKDLHYKLYDIKTEYGVSGIISEAEEDNDKVKPLIKAINILLNNTTKDRNEKDVAAEGFGHLRSAIELCVEHHIFKGTVKRYQKNVALTNFLKVDGELLNKHKDKLNEIFERCCEFINAHSNPTEIITQPTLNYLKIDLDAFEEIRAQFPL